MDIKNTPLIIGSVLLVMGLSGIVFSQFSVFWMWALVIAGIGVIVWVVVSKKGKDSVKK